MKAIFPLELPTPAFVAVSLGLGFLFGFFLERAGFSSATRLTGQFYFRDWSVLRVMFGAIVVAMLGLGWLALAGVLDMSAVYVPETYLWPQLVGGLVLGVGFILGGYCPGTSVVAAATGKLDALFFMTGIFAGIWLFGAAEPFLHDFHTSGARGPLTLPQVLNMTTGTVASLIASVALAAFWAAEMSETKWRLFEKTYGRRR
ncbi:MAG: YeeE/YedE thiosulfate transporter family protein [Bryobacteraceae bacterium]